MRIVNFIFVCLLIIIIFLIGSCHTFEKKYYKFIVNIEDQILKVNENILSVEVLSDEGLKLWDETRIHMLITFKDNQWILLGDVGYSHGGIDIYGINGYEQLRLKKVCMMAVFQ
jgi:hypothetical protein